MSRVVIVGAGLSGLAVAFRLQQLRPSVDLVLLEKQSRPGGNIWTETSDGFRVEQGPNGFLDAKPGMMNLCRDLGLGDRLLAASEGSRKNRYVYVQDRLQKLPGSPPAILTTPLLSWSGKLALLREPFRRRPSNVSPDESVAEFARRRFGKEAADVFIDALVTGIHAGDPEQLSVRAAFPRLVEYEATAGSVLKGVLRASKAKRRAAKERGEPPPPPQRMWSFREGLRVVVEALRDKISVPVGIGLPVRRLEPTPEGGWHVRGPGQEQWTADAVILTCPSYEQAEIVADVDAALAGDLAGIHYPPVVVAALGYRQADVPTALDGFGYIAPGGQKRDVLGVQWCSSIFPDRAPPGHVLWRVLCGGVSRPDLAGLNDEELLGRCHREMMTALNVRAEPVFTRVVRWPRAIPQYVRGHLERVDRIERAVSQRPGLFLTGNALHGIAMNDVAEQASRIAGQVDAYLASRTIV